MPELPEVETIKRDLEKIIPGKEIKKVIVNRAKVIKEPKPEEFQKRLKGKAFKHILRRGKVLAFELSSGQFLVVHLRMTGQLIYGPEDKTARVTFLLSDGKYLNFNDQRLLGELRLIEDWQKLSIVKNMGPEPLERSFTLKRFQEMLETKKTKIKPLLMDQSFIAGIGNLYAAEALFRASIHPMRPAGSLKNKETEKLFTAIKDILREAINLRGSSVDNYRDAAGEKGGFAERLKVYGRKNKPCFRCKTPIKRMALGGRGTYFCAKCQN